MTIKYPKLRQLMHAYFNQDVEDYFDSDHAVWQEFSRTNSLADRAMLVAEIHKFLVQCPHQTIASLIAEIGPTYHIGDTDAEARQWLLQAADVTSNDD